MPGQGEAQAAVHLIAYEQANRAIDQQLAQAEQLRGRLGVLVSAASVTAGLVASVALTRDHTKSLEWFGIVGLITAGVALAWITVTAVVVWWPSTGRYRLDPVIIIQQYADVAPFDESSTHRDLALYMAENWEVNAWALDRRHRWFAGSLVAFVVEIAALGVALWSATT